MRALDSKYSQTPGRKVCEDWTGMGGDTINFDWNFNAIFGEIFRHTFDTISSYWSLSTYDDFIFSISDFTYGHWRFRKDVTSWIVCYASIDLSEYM